jgi:hypothetical protein
MQPGGVRGFGNEILFEELVRPMAANKQVPETHTPRKLAGILYQLTVAFPSWAGGAVALYAIILSGFAAFRVRLR